ncbi:hypothetical protein Tco_0399414, partial [Tanacetum coccineum]
MSDSDESRVTHTEVSSLFEDLSNIGSPRADDHEYLELPYRDSRDPLGVLLSQSCQRRLVAVLRLDIVMASHFVFSLL